MPSQCLPLTHTHVPDASYMYAFFGLSLILPTFVLIVILESLSDSNLFNEIKVCPAARTSSHCAAWFYRAHSVTFPRVTHTHTHSQESASAWKLFATALCALVNRFCTIVIGMVLFCNFGDKYKGLRIIFDKVGASVGWRSGLACLLTPPTLSMTGLLAGEHKVGRAASNTRHGCCRLGRWCW